MENRLAVLSSLVPGSSSSGLLKSSDTEYHNEQASCNDCNLNDSVLILLSDLNLGELALLTAFLTDVVYDVYVGIGVGSEAVLKLGNFVLLNYVVTSCTVLTFGKAGALAGCLDSLVCYDAVAERSALGLVASLTGLGCCTGRALPVVAERSCISRSAS